MSQSSRRLGSVIWELNLAARIVDDTIKVKGKNKVSAKCQCKMVADDPTIICNKVLAMPDGSTSTIRHHIKEKHRVEYAKILKLERERDQAKSESAKELDSLVEDLEGHPDEPEEDLSAEATPGRKRPALACEEDLLETPKAKRTRPDVCKSVKKSIFHR
jgi:hypothetical protein